MEEEKYFYFRPDDAALKLVSSFYTPQKGDEVFKNGIYYIVDRVVYNLDSCNLSVYCVIKE